jgi:hypothetical protein
MPISDPEGYSKGHFQRVYSDILVPACDRAGFKAIRGDQVSETNLIHLDILQRLLHSPMALCDLSSRNPNVLFELGLRQAFDKPVALVREVGTPRIFDIEPLRYADYRQQLLYHEVLEDQESIAESLRATFEAHGKGKGINSLVKLLSLTHPAKLVEVPDADKDPMLQLIRAEITGLRQEFLEILRSSRRDWEQAYLFPSINFAEHSSIEWKHADYEKIKKSWISIREAACLLLPSQAASWILRARLVGGSENNVVIEIRAQDTPPTNIDRLIKQTFTELLGRQCKLVYRGIPSQ